MGATASTNKEQLGDFMVVKDESHLLGYGTYGRVYAGVRVSDKQPVAVKISSGYKKNLDMKKFDKEADLLLKKIHDHENIIKVYDVQRKHYKDGRVDMVDLWLITELCLFGNLKQYAQQKDLSVERKVELMYQSSLGVQHLHNSKPESVAHRDIKPENILVTGSEDKPVVKLCDFGCARTVMRVNDKSVTMKSRVGTPYYFAPEQTVEREGHTSYNKTADTFSLGVSFLALLEATAGDPMVPRTVNGKSLGEVMWESREREFVPTIDEPTDGTLTTAVKTIIKGMIQLEPSDRLSMDEVVDRLFKLKETASDLEAQPKVGPQPSLREYLLAMNDRSLWSDAAWKKLPDMPKEHYHQCMCYCGVLGGIIAVWGLGSGNNVTSMCHFFNLNTRCWRRLRDMPTARYWASAAVLGDKMLVVGGLDKDSKALAVCEILNLNNEEWSRAADLMEPLYNPLVATAAGRVFLIPRDNSCSDIHMQQYDPLTEAFSWAALPEDVQDTMGACLVAGPDGNLYLLGGKQQLAVQYDPVTKQWAHLQAKPVAKYSDAGCCGVVQGGKILLCGGSTNYDQWKTVETYDPDTQKWKFADFKLPFAFSRYSSHVVVADP